MLEKQCKKFNLNIKLEKKVKINIPEEIILKELLLLSLNEILNMRLISKSHKEIIDSNYFWYELLKRDFKRKFKNIECIKKLKNCEKEYKKLYKESLIPKMYFIPIAQVENSLDDTSYNDELSEYDMFDEIFQSRINRVDSLFKSYRKYLKGYKNSKKYLQDIELELKNGDIIVSDSSVSGYFYIHEDPNDRKLYAIMLQGEYMQAFPEEALDFLLKRNLLDVKTITNTYQYFGMVGMRYSRKRKMDGIHFRKETFDIKFLSKKLELDKDSDIILRFEGIPSHTIGKVDLELTNKKTKKKYIMKNYYLEEVYRP